MLFIEITKFKQRGIADQIGKLLSNMCHVWEFYGDRL